MFFGSTLGTSHGSTEVECFLPVSVILLDGHGRQVR